MEQKILETLDAIHRLLKSSTALSSGKMPTSRDRAQGNTTQREIKDGLRTFRAIGTAGKTTKDTILGLNVSFKELTGEVGKASLNFGSLNTQLTRFMSALQVPELKVPESELGVDSKLHPVFNELLAVNRQMAGSLASAIGLMNQPKIIQAAAPDVSVQTPAQKTDPIFNELLAVNRQMASSLATATSLLGALPRVQPPAADPAAAAAPVVSAIQNQAGGLRGMIGRLFPRRTPAPGPDRALPARGGRNIDDLDLPMRDVLGRMVERFGRTTSSLALFGVLLSQTTALFSRLTTDFMSLSRVGLGSVGSLYELSKNALLAGMSLGEYVRILRENSALASRAGSLDEFDRLTSVATNQLAVLGVFGAEARELQAVMANSSTMMGVSQENLASSMNAQVSLFDKLRKSTNMTAEEFANLVKSVADNDQAQKELIGLAPAQRVARQRELMQLASVGQRLGLASDASKKLADALIAQRGETVKSRIESAGRIRQLAAFAGMGAEGERAAQIVMKGRAATAAELEELRGFAGRLDARSQGMYEVGTLGTQNVIDELTKYLGENNFGKVMEANRPAALAESTGEVNNRQFGQHVSEFGQFVGKLTALVKGIIDSPVGLIGAAVSSALLLTFRGPILGLLSKVVGGGAAVGAGAAAGAAKTGSVLSKLVAPLVTLKDAALRLTPSMQGVGRAVGTAVQTVAAAPDFLRKSMNAVRLSTAISGPVQTAKFMLQELGTSIGNGARAVMAGAGSATSSIWSGMKTFTKSFGLVGAAFSSVFELFTGDISAALNPEGGFFNRLGGVVTSFFTAIPNMIIDTLAFVFGDEAMGRVRNSFDIIVSFMNMAIKDFFAKMIGGLGSLLKRILPDDSKLVKFLESTSEKLSNSAQSNAQTVERLWNDQSATLASISAENKQKAEQATVQAEQATTKARAAQSKFDSVHYGNQIDAGKLIAESKALIGTPQVEQPRTVAPQPAPVNTEERTGTQAAPNQTTAAANSPEVVAVLQNILQVLNQSLTLEQAQVMALGQMAGARPRAEFVPAEVIAQQLLGPRKGMTS